MWEGEDEEKDRDGLYSSFDNLPCCPEQNRLLQAPVPTAALEGLVAFIIDIPGELCGIGTGLHSQCFLCLYFLAAVGTRSLSDGHILGKVWVLGWGDHRQGREGPAPSSPCGARAGVWLFPVHLLPWHICPPHPAAGGKEREFPAQHLPPQTLPLSLCLWLGFPPFSPLQSYGTLKK